MYMNYQVPFQDIDIFSLHGQPVYSELSFHGLGDNKCTLSHMVIISDFYCCCVMLMV